MADAYTKIHEKEQLPESLKKKEKEMKDEVGVFKQIFFIVIVTSSC